MAEEKTIDEQIEAIKTSNVKIRELDEILRDKRKSNTSEKNIARVEELIEELMKSDNPNDMQDLLEYYDLITNDTTTRGSKWEDSQLFTPIKLAIGAIKEEILNLIARNSELTSDIDGVKKELENVRNENRELEKRVDANYAEHARQNAVKQAQSWKKAYDKEVVAHKYATINAHNYMIKYREALIELRRLRKDYEESEERVRAAVKQGEDAQKHCKVLTGILIGVGSVAFLFGAGTVIHAVGWSNANKNVVQLQNDVAQLEDQIKNATDTYKAEIARLNGIIADQNAEIARLQGEVDRLNAEIEAKNAEIARLQAANENKDAEIAALEAEKAELQEKLDAANATIAAKEAEIEALIAEKQELTENFTANINALSAQLEEITNYASDVTTQMYKLAGFEWEDFTIEENNGAYSVTTFEIPAEMTEVGVAHYTAAMNSEDPYYLQYADFTLDGNKVMVEGAAKIIEEAMNSTNDNQDEEGKDNNGGAGGVSDNNNGTGTQIGGGAGSQTDPEPEVTSGEEQGEEVNDNAAGEVADEQALRDANASKYIELQSKIATFLEDLRDLKYISTMYSNDEIAAKMNSILASAAGYLNQSPEEGAKTLDEAFAEYEFVVNNWVNVMLHY